MAIIATPSAIDANSYVTVEEAEAYFAERMYKSKWGAITDQDSALITSSRMLDWNLKFKGYLTLSSQSMCFPRLGILRSDGREVSGLEIPQEIKFATFEVALAFASSDRSADSDLAGIEQVKAGSLFIKATPAGMQSTKSGIIPDFVKSMLSDFITNSGMSVVRLMRA